MRIGQAPKSFTRGSEAWQQRELMMLVDLLFKRSSHVASIEIFAGSHVISCILLACVGRSRRQLARKPPPRLPAVCGTPLRAQGRGPPRVDRPRSGLQALCNSEGARCVAEFRTEPFRHLQFICCRPCTPEQPLGHVPFTSSGPAQ